MQTSLNGLTTTKDSPMTDWLTVYNQFVTNADVQDDLFARQRALYKSVSATIYTEILLQRINNVQASKLTSLDVPLDPVSWDDYKSREFAFLWGADDTWRVNMASLYETLCSDVRTANLLDFDAISVVFDADKSKRANSSISATIHIELA